jgi:hypothetical protein
MNEEIIRLLEVIGIRLFFTNVLLAILLGVVIWGI